MSTDAPGSRPCFISLCDPTRRRIYQEPAAACAVCALRTQCTTSPRGRRISRSLDEEDGLARGGRPLTEAYAKAMRKRKVWVEPLFAEANDWYGLRRFRGSVKATIQAQLIAAGQNLKRLLSRWDWVMFPASTGFLERLAKKVSQSRMGSRCFFQDDDYTKELIILYQKYKYL